MIFPKLYKNNRFFKMYFVDNYYWSEYGIINKKINKSNKRKSTLKKVKTLFNNKILSGYSTNKNNIIKFQPMLSYKYNKMQHHIIFPAYIQPKLNGFRAIYNNNKLYSKQNKVFNHVKEITNSLNNIPKNIYLDGELLSDNLNNLKSLFSIKNPNIKSLSYVVFDLYDSKNPNMKLVDRLKLIKKLINQNKYIKITKTYIIKNKNEINKYFNKFIKQNYEGLVIKNINSIYKFKKSFDIQSIKLFYTNKFKVIGFKKDINGKIIFKLKCLKSNDFFYSVTKGTINNINNYINKFVNVKYINIDNNGCVTQNPVVLLLNKN